MIPSKIHVLQIAGSQVGGIRKHIHAIIKYLPEEAFVQSYAYSTRINDATFRQEVAQFRERGRVLLPLPILRNPHPLDVANLARLIRLVRAARVDIVHGHGAKGGLYARLLAMCTGVKAIYTPHGGSLHSMFSPAADKAFTAIERALVGLTHTFVFESDYSAAKVRAKVGARADHARIKINYNGIEPPSEADPAALGLAQPRPEGRFNLGVFAMLREIKGQHVLLRAVPMLAALPRPVHIHMFGDGPDRPALEAQARDLGCADRVTFHGDVDQPLDHMRTMDLIVVPSLFESFCYAALEAVVLGKPVVASNTGGVPEVLAGYPLARLVAPGDADALAGAIIASLAPAGGEPPPAAVIGGVPERFSMKRMISGLEFIYRETATKPPP